MITLEITLLCYLKLNTKQNMEETQNVNFKTNAQRLPIALAQVKGGNTSEDLLNEIRQIRNSLYRAKEITKIVYNDIMNSIKL